MKQRAKKVSRTWYSPWIPIESVARTINSPESLSKVVAVSIPETAFVLAEDNDHIQFSYRFVRTSPKKPVK